jgi:RHS repeat-associated protein
MLLIGRGRERSFSLLCPPFRLVRAGAFGPVVAEVETTGGGPRTYVLGHDASQNVDHVVRTAGGTTDLEGPPRRWTAFGSLRSGTSALERGYASQATEGSSGLVLMGARHYDPATGRFLQPDPLGIEVSELYAYAANNPYVFWDPTGLSPTVSSRPIESGYQAWGATGDFSLTGSPLPGGNSPGIGEAEVSSATQGEYRSPETLRALVPGQIAWDTAVNSYRQGEYGYAAEYLGAMLGEQTLTVATFGLVGGSGIVRGASEAVTLSQGGVQANRAAGNAFRDEIAALLRAAGREVATEVYKPTPFGKRFIDIEVSLNGEVLGGIETKLGTSAYRASQRAKDAWLWLRERYIVNVVRGP